MGAATAAGAVKHTEEEEEEHEEEDDSAAVGAAAWWMRTEKNSTTHERAATRRNSSFFMMMLTVFSSSSFSIPSTLRLSVIVTASLLSSSLSPSSAIFPPIPPIPLSSFPLKPLLLQTVASARNKSAGKEKPPEEKRVSLHPKLSSSSISFWKKGENNEYRVWG